MTNASSWLALHPEYAHWLQAGDEALLYEAQAAGRPEGEEWRVDDCREEDRDAREPC